MERGSAMSGYRKRVLTVTIAVVLALGLLGISGCGLLPGGGGRSVSTSDLVGTWEEVDIDDTYIFSSDGTGREIWDGDTYIMSSWKVQNNHLTMNFIGNTEEYDIELSSDGRTLTVKQFPIDFTYKKR
jgi:hypothetical protein